MKDYLLAPFRIAAATAIIFFSIMVFLAFAWGLSWVMGIARPLSEIF
jgi:hypothetical protein